MTMGVAGQKTEEKLFKAKVVAMIAMYFGDNTAELYRACYVELPIDFVEKSSEKLFTEYLGTERACALVKQIKAEL